MEGKSVVIYGGELYHHGVKGQKWGVRNYQNEDGSLTEAGKRRYAKEEYRAARQKAKETYGSESLKNYDKHLKKYETIGKDIMAYDNDQVKTKKQYKKDLKEAKKVYKEEMAKAGGLSDKQKKALTIGAAVVVAGLAAYGSYKISQRNSESLSKLFDGYRVKGQNFLDRFESTEMKDASEQGALSVYRFTDNPYIKELNTIMKKYNNNIYNRLNKKSVNDLGDVEFSRIISGHADDDYTRMLYNVRKVMNKPGYNRRVLMKEIEKTGIKIK